MASYNHFETEAEEERAEMIIEDAIKLAEKNDLYTAIQMFQSALNIFIDIGRYMRLSEIFDLLLTYVRSESEMVMVIETLKNTLMTVEYLDIPQEEVKLKQSLANLAYKNKDYRNAAKYYTNVGRLYHQLDQETNRVIAGTNLLRAAECFEKLELYQKGEKRILEGIRIFDISNFNYKQHFETLKDFIFNKDYEQSIEEIERITNFLNRLIDQLSHYLENANQNLQNLQSNVKSRLRHMISEFRLLKMVCFRRLGEEKKVIRIAEENVNYIISNIEDMKKEFSKSYFSTADLHRFTFDLFLLQFFQEYSKKYIEDPIFLATSGLNDEIKQIILKMKFYKFTIDLLEYNLNVIEDFMEDLPLSPVLTPFKEFIYKSIK